MYALILIYSALTRGCVLRIAYFSQKAPSYVALALSEGRSYCICFLRYSKVQCSTLHRLKPDLLPTKDWIIFSFIFSLFLATPLSSTWLCPMACPALQAVLYLCLCRLSTCFSLPHLSTTARLSTSFYPSPKLEKVQLEYKCQSRKW